MDKVATSTWRTVIAIVAPTIVGWGMVILSTFYFQEYSLALFVLLPFFLGFGTTAIYSANEDKGLGRCFLVSLATILVVGFFLLVAAAEGLICLAMSLPLAIPLIFLGTLLAWAINRERGRRTTLGLSALSVLVLPFLMGFEYSHKSWPVVHKVVSRVEVNAPIEKVWHNVIEFPEINTPPEGILRLGFAYPLNAKINGTGVGAIRYCNFNTGAFVEPIKVWDEPHVLAFDVVDQPAPMIETSFYSDLHSAHLDYLRSQHGEFHLYENNGHTIVEGTTFYTHDIAPDLYWSIFSDQIIHRIHMRVLNHIKEVSEQ